MYHVQEHWDVIANNIPVSSISSVATKSLFSHWDLPFVCVEFNCEPTDVANSVLQKAL